MSVGSANTITACLLVSSPSNWIENQTSDGLGAMGRGYVIEAKVIYVLLAKKKAFRINGDLTLIGPKTNLSYR